MSSNCLVAPTLACLVLLQPNYAEAQATSRLAHVTTLLESGETVVPIVCFGDSITGVYYHTGGRRAWCDMLGIALGKAYPKAKVQMINAGISGNTTPQGLARMERDVLAHRPRLVVVMYGMNDVVRTEPEAFRANLQTIVRRCRASGAAVVLSTPNSVYPNAPRPMARLEEFAQIVRDVGEELSVCLADCFSAYEALRKEDVTEWRLLMSETIHPGMNGHKKFAEVMTQAISCRQVSLADAGPPADSLRFTLARLSAKQPLDVVAMPPYDRIVPEALRGLFPEAEIRVSVWPVEGQSLSAIEEWGKGVRKRKPHLVVVAVPGDRGADDEETFLRSYNWVLNWSVDFGQAHWDLVPILPSVGGELTDEERGREALARRITMGIDTRWIERKPGDGRSADEIVVEWIAEQHKAAQ
ncbi:MAG: SGNH/GDSL hydrolase family protein [Planctomycetes bacterium]|nr:SGNH/GDSL hydrolase family protein [Planctomycetota bacterium]